MRTRWFFVLAAISLLAAQNSSAQLHISGIRLGSRSAVIAEIFYHDAKVKRNETKSKEGLPVWSQVNLAGLGFRGGLRFGLW